MAESRTSSVGDRRGIAGLIGAAAVAALILALPLPAGLSPEGRRMGVVFAITLILWVTEAIPIAVTALLGLALQPLFGVATLQAAFTSFISTVFFFVIAMFCIAQAFISTGLDRRFALWLLARAGTDSRRVLLAFLVGPAVLSSVVSDVPCTAIFMAVAVGLLDRVGAKPGASRFGQAVMMGIPIAAFIGGVATPAGSSINVLALDFIQRYGHVTVPFLYWMAIGIPLAVLLVPVAWWALLRFYPPEMERIDLGDLVAERARLGPLTAPEKKVLVILGLMLTFWILNTWFKQIDVALVAVLGATTMFLPGIRLFTWKEVERGTGWEVLLMVGGVTSLGAAAVETGLAKWVVDAALGGLGQGSPWLIVAGISTFTVLIHLILTIVPVIVAVVIPPITLLAAEAGHNPALYALPVAFTASCAFLLPLDAVPLVTYAKGYYRMLDMLKPGIVISLAWIVVMTGLMVVLGPALGFF
ncbi:MAG: DASS family sodium-coupled anion symporter [Gemmatimonadales bacterium]